jgi:hypothetical protein
LLDELQRLVVAALGVGLFGLAQEGVVGEGWDRDQE